MTEHCPEKFRLVRGKLIVSCQAGEDDLFHGADQMVRFARAAVAGGAAAIRANGPGDIRAIRRAVPVPIIGLQKQVMPDGKILITPDVAAARALVAGGADAVAVDCTARGCGWGALARVGQIRNELRSPIAADIATVEEAVAAEAAGAGFVLSTMRGYTADTAHVRSFDPQFIAALVHAVRVPVIAEGRIWTVEEALAALSAGAFAVVIGSAITRPRDIASRFASAIARSAELSLRPVLGIHLGGTNVKAGLVSPAGVVSAESSRPACVSLGRSGLLDQMAEIATSLIASARRDGNEPVALGVAGWTDAPIAETLAPRLELPVFVENDANARAVGEKWFGSARTAHTFVFITLGAGVGGACYIDGQLHPGAHFMAGAVGHLTVEPGGLPCNCGRGGCLEQYANAAALLRYAGGERYPTAASVIAAANAGDDRARQAIRTFAGYLARGCALIVDLLDPELIVFSGGLAQDNPLLYAEVDTALSRLVLAGEKRRLSILGSSLGNFGGVAGAAAVAFERLSRVR